MKFLRFGLVLAALMSSVAFTACFENDGAMEEAGEDIDEAVEDAGDKIEDATD